MRRIDGGTVTTARPATANRFRSHRRAGLAWLAALGLVASACTSGSARAGMSAGNGRAVFRLAIDEPSAIDPARAVESEGLLVTKQLYDGLLRLDPQTQAVRPGVAERWESNQTCTAWTFHLRRGTTFSNGEPVTARSFIDGMTRAAARAATSQVAYHLAGIRGYDELHVQGTATTFAGLSAPDPSTLVVALSEPDCEFDKKTFHPVMSPVPSSAPPAGTRSFGDLPVGNGPFRMKEPWRHDERITLVRNEHYQGPRPGLDEIVFRILPATSAAGSGYRGFKGGVFDLAHVPPALVPEAAARYGRFGGLIQKPSFTIYYLLPSTFDGPLQTADARQAISYAIDREAISRGVFKGMRDTATSLLPPLFTAYRQPDACPACRFDPQLARELAARAGLHPGTRLDLAILAGAGVGTTAMQAVAGQLRQHLGLEVNLEPLPLKELLQYQASDEFRGLASTAWMADYPTPDNFLFPLLSRTSFPPGDNPGRYDNPEFDRLVAQARATPSEAERVRLVQAAERLAIGRDQALIPLFYGAYNVVFDARRWVGVDIDFFGNPTLATIRKR